MCPQYNVSDKSVNSNIKENSGLSFRKSKKAKKPFTIVDRSFMQLNGKYLSDISFRIICYLMSLPEDWHVIMSNLANHLDVGKEKLQNAMRELADKGYIRRQREKREDGTFIGYVTEYSDEPEFLEVNKETTGCRKNRLPEKPGARENGPYIINSIDNIKNNNNTQEDCLSKEQSVVVSFSDLEINIITNLVKYGVKELSAKSLVKQFNDPGYIQSKIDLMHQGKAIGDRAAWLVSAITDNYIKPKIEASPVTSKSETSEHYEERKRLERLREENHIESQRELAVIKYNLQNLSREEQDIAIHEHGLAQIKAAKDIIASQLVNNSVPSKREIPSIAQIRNKVFKIKSNKLIAENELQRMKIEQETLKTFYGFELSGEIS